MLGIVFNVDKLVEMVRYSYTDEISHLRQCLLEKECHIRELENLIFKHTGLIREETQPAQANIKDSGPTVVRNWRGLKDAVERKLRPPELVERERRWKAAAAEAAMELSAEEKGGEKDARQTTQESNVG